MVTRLLSRGGWAGDGADRFSSLPPAARPVRRLTRGFPPPRHGSETQSLRIQIGAQHAVSSVRNPEPCSRIQSRPPGPPLPTRPKPATVGPSQTCTCAGAPRSRAAQKPTRAPPEAYMQALRGSRGVLGAAPVAWAGRSCMAAARQPSLSQTNLAMERVWCRRQQALSCRLSHLLYPWRAAESLGAS